MEPVKTLAAGKRQENWRRKMADNESHFCICPSDDEPLLHAAAVEEGVGLGTRAAVLNAAKWEPGSRIRVRFIEGDPSLTDRVKAVAREWIGSDMANLSLDFVGSGDAEIRVAFQQGNGSWSYLGTQCRAVPKSQPTMNYGWLTPSSPDDELRRVVLHEFGHALGLIHEHQNPQSPITWNKDAVTRDLSGPPNRWDAATIFNNMFKLYQPREVTATDVDPTSIMMYPIPASWTLDGTSAGFNGELSDQDKQLIREVYPWA
jgi:serralysin